MPCGEACPTFHTLTLDNGKVKLGGFTRRVKEIQPPGYNGLLIMHMGKDRRGITVEGTFEEGVGGTGIDKLLALMGLIDTSVYDFTTFGKTFKKVRLVDVQSGEQLTVIRGGAVSCDAKYTAIFVQLKDEVS